MAGLVTGHLRPQRVGFRVPCQSSGDERSGIVALATALAARDAKQVALRTERDAANGDDGARHFRRMCGIHFAGLEHGEGLLVNTVQKTDEQLAELLPAMAQTKIIGDVFLSLGSRQGQRETLDSVTA